jgi:hypothetical protein
MLGCCPAGHHEPWDVALRDVGCWDVALWATVNLGMWRRTSNVVGSEEFSGFFGIVSQGKGLPWQGPAMFYHSIPYRQPTTDWPISRPGVGCPQGEFSISVSEPLLDTLYSIPHTVMAFALHDHTVTKHTVRILATELVSGLV